MLAGAFVWSQVVATFCGVLSMMNPATTGFRSSLSALNSYMSLHNLPNEMQQTLRDYFHRTRACRALDYPRWSHPSIFEFLLLSFSMPSLLTQRRRTQSPSPHPATPPHPTTTGHLWNNAASREALMKMSPKLQGEVLLHTNGQWIRKVPWLSNEDPRFLVEVIRTGAQTSGQPYAPSSRFAACSLLVICSD